MKYLNTFILAISVAASLCGQTSHAAQNGWKLIWADEFDTDGEPASHWSYEQGFVRNHELQWYQPQNARVVDGVLQITGRLETVENTRFDASSNDWRRNRREARYTSTCLTTANSFHFRYGRLEVRARIPVAEGAWPAIWTLGNRWGWPACGEIDVMEFYRVPPATMGIHHDDQSASTQRTLPIILANACWQGENGGDQWNTCRVPFSHFTERDAEWASKFHTWRMDWTPDAIRLYLDDELLNDIPTASAQKGGGAHHDVNPFDNDIEGFGHYILLNLAIGSSGGTPDELAFPLLYEIDYVRVYQQK